MSERLKWWQKLLPPIAAVIAKATGVSKPK